MPLNSGHITCHSSCQNSHPRSYCTLQDSKTTRQTVVSAATLAVAQKHSRCSHAYVLMLGQLCVVTCELVSWHQCDCNAHTHCKPSLTANLTSNGISSSSTWLRIQHIHMHVPIINNLPELR